VTVAFPYGEIVVVVRAGLADDGYGNPTQDWNATTSTTYGGCAVAQGAKGGATEDLTGDRNVVVSDLIVFMPSGADVRATDRLEVRGRQYEVVGEPFDWINPFTGTAFGTVVYCNRVEG
jgi:head-tail adaptor